MSFAPVRDGVHTARVIVTAVPVSSQPMQLAATFQTFVALTATADMARIQVIDILLFRVRTFSETVVALILASRSRVWSKFCSLSLALNSVWGLLRFRIAWSVPSRYVADQKVFHVTNAEAGSIFFETSTALAWLRRETGTTSTFAVDVSAFG